jgi:hypothetical protein
MTELISRRELAAKLQKPIDTLAHWAVIGYGPPSVRLGSQCYYRVADVEKFIDQLFESAARA